jgi:diguanylate cyclase (GGDEF)-like protein
MTAHVVPLRRTAAAAWLPGRARGVSLAASVHHTRWADFGVIFAAGAVAQLFATHTSGNQVFHTGLAFTVAAALLLPPELVVLVAVGQHVPEWIRQRYPWFIQTFNTANVVLSGLAAWAVRDALERGGWHIPGSPTAAAVAASAAAVAAYLVVNHALLARMLLLARGHNAAATGLFSLDGLLADGAVASVGIGVAFALVHQPALAVTAILPLVLLQRALVVPALRQQAFSDHKTGLRNSRGIEQSARSEFARARRARVSLSVLVCDINDLRGINNRFGHLQGDAALFAVAESFRAVLRPYDLCGRIGGDEFLVVLPETTHDESVAIAERIRGALEARPVATHLGEFHVSLSIGAASLRDEDTRIGELVERADAVMYAAKSAGGASSLTVG